MSASLITDQLFHPGDGSGDLCALRFTVCCRRLKNPLYALPVVLGQLNGSGFITTHLIADHKLRG
jgi:hypothetical protein